MRAFIVAGALLIGMLPSWAADRSSAAGTLTCSLGNVGTEHKREISCEFRVRGGGTQERYSGSLTGNFSSNTDLLVLIWTVMGPEESLPSGALAQQYNRADLVQGGVPMWVGASNSAIKLQFETNNSATEIGINQIELKLSTTSASLSDPPNPR